MTMYKLPSFRWLLCLAFLLGIQCAAVAGVTVGGTRLILGEKDRETSISIKNTGKSPYVVQAWIDSGEGKNKTPLLVTPPLSRLDPGMENILRVMRTAGPLASDRESVFWLNVKEIPEKSQEEGVLQIALRSRLKLFYRPRNLAGKPDDARTKLRWVVAAGDGNHGAVLKVANASAFHVTFTALKINGGQQAINADMVPPFGEISYPLTAVKTPQSIIIRYTTINDYGGETPEEMVRVPAGVDPVDVPIEVAPSTAGEEPERRAQ